LAYTIDDYNNLKTAIAQGATRVKSGDKEIDYRSLEEMKAILRDMENQLGISSSNSCSSVFGARITVIADKGL
jgi:hypothetical protein